VTCDTVVVLAVDYPFVTLEIVAELIRAAESHEGAALQDEGGSMHYVVGAYQVNALRSAVDAKSPSDASMRSLFGTLDVVAVRANRAAFDIDTPEDIERARSSTAGED
jgi:molybdopterin-guanine dinucleotide biosynthesis protein A